MSQQVLITYTILHLVIIQVVHVTMAVHAYRHRTSVKNSVNVAANAKIDFLDADVKLNAIRSNVRVI